MNLEYVLEQMTPKSGVPPRFPALVDWVNTGGCPEALAEASRRLTEWARKNPDGLADLPITLTGEGWATLPPGEFVEVTGLSDDGGMVVGRGYQPAGNAAKFHLSITALAELWLALPRENRPQFPLNPLVHSWLSSRSVPVSRRNLISPAVIPGASGEPDLPLARAPGLLSAASVPLKLLNAPVNVVKVDGEPLVSPSAAPPRAFYRPFRPPTQGELWPAPRTIAKADALCPIVSALAAHPLDSDGRGPLRSYVYRIALLAHALSGPAFIPEHAGVQWLTGGPVNETNRRRFWDAMAVADSLIITIDPITHEWRKLVVADPGDGGIHLSPPAWHIIRGERTGGFRLTGALWRPAVLAPRVGRGSKGVGVWGGLQRTLAGIEAALSYGPTGGRGPGARTAIFLRPENPGGPGPSVFIPWDKLLALAGECVPYGGESRNTAGRRYRRRVAAMVDLGYLATGKEAPAADTIEILDRPQGRRHGAEAGIVVRATARFAEAQQRAQNQRNWSLRPASALLEKVRAVSGN